MNFAAAIPVVKWIYKLIIVFHENKHLKKENRSLRRRIRKLEKFYNETTGNS
jgi:hypothetical protein